MSGNTDSCTFASETNKYLTPKTVVLVDFYNEGASGL